MGKFKDLTGQKFGRLTIIKRVENQGKRIMWLCKCSCGKKKVINGESLKLGKTQSCGCLQRELASKIKITHGKSKKRVYKIWQGIKIRCYDKNCDAYQNYGGRGIIICQEWLNDFMNFYNWAMKNGYSDDLTLDRIDCNGSYKPLNCRWVTMKQQQRNKRNNHLLTYNGETHCINEWAEIKNKKRQLIQSRLSRGWTIERALTTPQRKCKKPKKVKCIETNEVFNSTKDAENKTGIKMSLISACCNKRSKSSNGYHWKYVD